MLIIVFGDISSINITKMNPLLQKLFILSFYAINFFQIYEFS